MSITPKFYRYADAVEYFDTHIGSRLKWFRAGRTDLTEPPRLEHAINAHVRDCRMALATTLRSGHRRLTALRAQLAPVDLYPRVPMPTLGPHRKGDGLPAVPGIYFLWRGDVVEYVGKSRCLSNRVRLGSHHTLKQYHRISFLPWPETELAWAECYYIGVLRPAANFGANW